MKEKSIEETIKQLELILKVRKEQKEIIECAGGSCINCDPDIRALTESIDILSDYKRVLKINEVLLKENEILKEEKEQAWEEWNNLEQASYETEQKLKQQIKESQKENKELNYKLHSKKIALEIYNRYIPKSKVEDIIEELKINLVNMQGEELLIYESKIDILQELLGESEE